MKKEEEEYLASEAHKKYKEDKLSKEDKGQDDEYADNDPEGWTAYLHAAEGQDEACFAWANTTVECVSNPMLSAKCV